MILARYIAWNCCRSGALVLFLLLALFSFLGLAEALEDVGKGAFSTSDAIATVLLTTPARIISLLPVAALLGSVLGLGSMANQHELVALRAGGLSSWRLAAILAALAAMLSALALVTMFVVIPLAEREAQEFRSRTLDQTDLGGAAFWSRSGERVIRVGHVEFGHIPRNIEIYEFDEDHRLARLLLAKRALILDAGTWQLQSVKDKVINNDEVLYRELEDLRWESFLSADQVSTLITPADALSALDLYRYLDESADSGIDTRRHETLLWRQVSLPLALFAMVLLALPLVINSVRARSAGYRVLIGGGIGIAFYLFEQTASQLAVLLQLPPAATALLPATLVLTAALAAIHANA